MTLQDVKNKNPQFFSQENERFFGNYSYTLAKTADTLHPYILTCLAKRDGEYTTAQYSVNPDGTIAGYIIPSEPISEDTDNHNRKTALAQHLDCASEDIWAEAGDNIFSANVNEYQVLYQVLTEEEAEEAWDVELEQYLDDCILPELPKTAQQYFDRDRWKDDAKIDGRGHCINHYDGSEECETVLGVDYYIYRIN